MCKCHIAAIFLKTLSRTRCISRKIIMRLIKVFSYYIYYRPQGKAMFSEIVYLFTECGSQLLWWCRLRGGGGVYAPRGVSAIRKGGVCTLPPMVMASSDSHYSSQYHTGMHSCILLE